jgi:putative FmdB family regulatory protein
MPTYEYEALTPETGCENCRKPFDCIQRLSDPPLAACPACGKPVREIISMPSIGPSTASFDDKAKKGGFHKLKRLGKGEYEVKY